MLHVMKSATGMTYMTGHVLDQLYSYCNSPWMILNELVSFGASQYNLCDIICLIYFWLPVSPTLTISSAHPSIPDHS